jgi:hypothetical protein
MRRIASVPNWSLKSRLSMTYALTGFLPCISFQAEIGWSPSVQVSTELTRGKPRARDMMTASGQKRKSRSAKSVSVAGIA